MKLTTTTQVSVDGVMQGLTDPQWADTTVLSGDVAPSGVSIQVYRPSGRPQYATATAD